MKFLITGFEPFDGRMDNPSKWVAGKLAYAEDFSEAIETAHATLPVSYKHAPEILIQLMEEHLPDYVLCFGMSDRNSALYLESQAENIDCANCSDNDGEARFGMPIRANGEGTLHSTLPLNDLEKELRKEKIPAHISLHAGNFVCNHLFYQGLYHIRLHSLPCRMGFVHIPQPTESFSINDMVKGGKVIVETLNQYNS